MGRADDGGGAAQGGGQDLDPLGDQVDELAAQGPAQGPPPQPAGAGQAAGDNATAWG